MQRQCRCPRQDGGLGRAAGGSLSLFWAQQTVLGWGDHRDSWSWCPQGSLLQGQLLPFLDSSLQGSELLVYTSGAPCLRRCTASGHVAWAPRSLVQHSKPAPYLRTCVQGRNSVPPTQASPVPSPIPQIHPPTRARGPEKLPRCAPGAGGPGLAARLPGGAQPLLHIEGLAPTCNLPTSPSPTPTPPAPTPAYLPDDDSVSHPRKLER